MPTPSPTQAPSQLLTIEAFFFQHCSQCSSLPQGQQLLEQLFCETSQGPRNQPVQSTAQRWALETFNRQLGRREGDNENPKTPGVRQ